ncbi:MAG: MFS transporter [Proteobacteria bacterium]|nr:MFS transporter [Pseudomonadota bacterium]
MNEPDQPAAKKSCGGERAGAQVPADSPALPPRRWALAHRDIRTIVLGLMLAMFLAALNQTIVATALPTIGREFHDFENLSWVVTAYLLTSTAAAPLYGKLSDIHGRRSIMLWCIGIFIAGSVVCALSPNLVTLIAGRALQGLGGGGILPVAQAVIADVIAPRERGRYQAYMGTMWVSAGLAGPVLGGAIAEYGHWSLIFWINLPIAVVAAIITYFNLRLLPRNDRRHALDIPGALLLMAASTPLLLALSWGGARYPWSSPPILLLLAGALTLAIVFAWWLLHARDPFLPLAVLANPVMRTGTACTAFSQGVVIALTIYAPLYFELVNGLAASDSGMALIPLVVMSTPGSILAGRGMMHVVHYKRLPLACLALSIATLAYLAWRPAQSPLALALLLSVVAFGIGTTYPTATTSIQNAVSRYQVGAAMGTMNFFRALVATFLVAGFGAILLAGIGVAPERGLGGGRMTAALAAGVDLAGVFRWIFAAGAFMLVLSLIALMRMEERPLRGSGEG